MPRLWVPPPGVTGTNDGTLLQGATVCCYPSCSNLVLCPMIMEHVRMGCSAEHVRIWRADNGMEPL